MVLLQRKFSVGLMLAALIPLGSACITSPIGPGPGILVHFGDTAATVVPDSARVGDDVTVAVTTFVSDCHRQGPTDFSWEGATLIVRPVDINELHESGACNDVLKFFRHEVTVTLRDSGEVVVLFRGSALPTPRDVSLRRSIMVSQ